MLGRFSFGRFVKRARLCLCLTASLAPEAGRQDSVTQAHLVSESSVAGFSGKSKGEVALGNRK